jgi:hypothetical protein
MEMAILERKFGSLVELTLDDGRILWAPFNDETDLAGALRELADKLAEPKGK